MAERTFWFRKYCVTSFSCSFLYLQITTEISKIKKRTQSGLSFYFIVFLKFKYFGVKTFYSIIYHHQKVKNIVSNTKSLRVLKVLRVLSDKILFRIVSDRVLFRVLRDRVLFRVLSGRVLFKALSDGVLFRVLSNRVLFVFPSNIVLFRVFSDELSLWSSVIEFSLRPWVMEFS